MATKTAEKKSADKKKTASAAQEAGAAEQLAVEYLVNRAHQAIAAEEGPAKLADIVKVIGEEEVTPNVLRHVLAAHPDRFVSVDRRWDIAARSADRSRPVLQLAEEIMAAYAAPMTAEQVARELGAVLARSTEGTLATAERILTSSGRFFEIEDEAGDKQFGLTSWLLDTSDDYHTEDDVLFYNYLPANAAKPYAALSLDWQDDAAASALKVLGASAGPVKTVDNRLLLFLAWRNLQEDYDGAQIFQSLVSSGVLTTIPEHRWTDAAGLDAIRAALRSYAQHVAQMPQEEPAEGVEAAPLTVSAGDLDAIERLVTASEDHAVSAGTLVEAVYEADPSDRTFKSDVDVALAALQAHPDRFLWVGYDRFRSPGTLPPYIGQVPESLTFPHIPQVETPEGDLLDQMLDDEGFERGLEKEILSPVAQDVGDQETAEETIWPQRASAAAPQLSLILKAHHKEIGTFPLCQIPPGFFATEPSIVELTLRDKTGAAYEVYADYETQLLYGLGLFDLYATIPADSGALFTLEKTVKPGEFLFVSNNETDPDTYISPERMEQLQSYRAELEAGPTVSTHDVARYILEHSNQAMSYGLLLTETNVVRRTTRRQLASILSAWSGFVHRAGAWSYDPKKAQQGFNKAKRKYVK